GHFAARQPWLSRRLQGNPDLPARLYVHESGCVRGDHVVAAAQSDWRRDRRHGRTLPARAGRSRADAAVPAFTRRHSARRRVPGQVLHLSEPDRKQTLRTGLARRVLLAVRTLLLSEDCERHADEPADGDRTTAHQPRNALRAGRDGARDDRDRSLSRAFYSQRELVARDCAIAACGGSVEMKLRAASYELRANKTAACLVGLPFSGFVPGSLPGLLGLGCSKPV